MAKAKKSKAVVSPMIISRREFSDMHFTGHQFDSDPFYVGLANKLLTDIKKFFLEQEGFTYDICKRTALALACYVEDLVAGPGVWAAFTSLCRKRYGCTLPFFDIKEDAAFFPYSDDVPSLQAVKFLIWYVANDAKPDIFMNPENPGLNMLAVLLMPDLLKAYDDAPPSPGRPMLQPEEVVGVPLFFQIRSICGWLCHDCYLTRIVDLKKVTDELKTFIKGLISDTGDGEYKKRLDYAERAFVPMNTRIGPLAIPAYEWLAEIVSLEPEPQEEQFLPMLKALKSRPYEFYKYETVGERELVLVDINGERLTLSADSMPDGKFMPGIEPGKSAMLSLVQLDGVWLMNGIGMQILPGEAYEKTRRKHLENKEQGENAFTYLLKVFKKKRIGVCASYKEYIDIVYKGNPPADLVGGEIEDDIRECGNMLYFLNSDGIMTILPGWARSVKLRNNPFYDKEEASLDARTLILNHDLGTPELREYIIEHKLIPDAALNSYHSPLAGHRLFQKNIRFINDYCDRDTINIVGKI